jgi:signal transduction histidine kinase/CheY-like chemotaxis protein
MRYLKRWILNLKVRNKIIFIVIASIVTSLSTAILLFVIYDRESYRTSMIQEITVLSDVISKRSSAAILFGDNRAATANLESLSAKKNLKVACIYDKEKKVFSFYSRSTNNRNNCPKLPFDGENIFTYTDDNKTILVDPINFSGKKIGWIYLEISMDGLTERMRDFSLIAVFIFLISGLVAYLFAISIQRFITQPLINLQHVLRTITKSRDYSLRAKKESTDEFGLLVDDFNRMLHMVQEANMRLSDVVEEIKSQKEESDDKALGAEKRTAAIKDFFAGVSHDLKQPLSAINLFLGVIENERDETKRNNYISKVQESSQNLNSLFDELLDMSRIDQIMNDVKLKRVRVQDLLGRIVKDFDVMARDKGLELRVNCPELYVYSDFTMLERIIRNLLANAIRYTDSGGILLACRRNGANASIEIWDTGIGIPEDKMEAIFSRYTQLNNPDQEAINGFGLGLSIVSRLSTSLDHSLTLASKVGRGTVFKLQVPLLNELKEVDEVFDEWYGSNQLFGKFAIVIDDEKSIAEAMLAATMAWDLEAQIACSIDELELLLTRLDTPPDIVLTDYSLSATETGLMALDMIEKHFDKPILAIVITGEKDPEILKEIEYYGCHYLPKPIDLKILKNKIDLVLNKQVYEH